MSPPTSTGKRKANALGGGENGKPSTIARLKDAKSVSDPDPSTMGTPHIPPPVWGHVLDYMPYEEVRSALLVGKIIANEAVEYVRTLNFMKGYQLDVPSARRFPNVEEVNCLSLFSGQHFEAILCRDTTIRLVPLLGTFPKLKSIDIRGLLLSDPEEKEPARVWYSATYCSSPENDSDLFIALCQSFLGAFKARLIPPNLSKIKGLVRLDFRGERLCSQEEGKGMCQTCKDICEYFPLKDICENSHCFCDCVDHVEVCETIANRKGAKEIFQRDSFKRLSPYLVRQLSEFALENLRSKEEESLRQKLFGLGIKKNTVPGVWYLSSSDLNDIDRLITVGYDPRSISKERLYEGMELGRDDREYDVFARATFDALVARGFALEEADLIVLDERTEPALKGLSKRIRGGED